MDSVIIILSITAILILICGFILFISAKLFKELSKLKFIQAIFKPIKKIDKYSGYLFELLLIILIWLLFNPIFFLLIILSYFKDKKNEKEYLTGKEGMEIIYFHFPIFLLWIAGALKVISIIF